MQLQHALNSQEQKTKKEGKQATPTEKPEKSFKENLQKPPER